MKVYAATDIGRVRPINEDSYYAPKPGERFCAVADGMGGHNAGEVASAMAVRVLEEEMRAPISPTEEALRRAVERANEQIWRASKEREGCAGMGTTITALCMEGNIAHIAQVGDSRAYLIRNRAILQVTTDHTLVEEMVLSGLITPSATTSPAPWAPPKRSRSIFCASTPARTTCSCSARTAFPTP